MCLAVLGLFFLSWARELSSLLFSLILLAFGFSFVSSYLPSLLSIHTTPHSRGQIMGVYEGIGSLSRICGPLLAFAIMAFTLTGYYKLIAFIIVITAIVFQFNYLNSSYYVSKNHQNTV